MPLLKPERNFSAGVISALPTYPFFAFALGSTRDQRGIPTAPTKCSVPPPDNRDQCTASINMGANVLAKAI